MSRALRFVSDLLRPRRGVSPPTIPGGTTKRRKAVSRARVPIGSVVTIAYVLLAHPTWRSLLASVPLVAGGLWLRGYASGYLVKNRRLATQGPYGHTRNPLYLGSLLIAAGFALASARWPLGLALLALFAGIYVPTILDEERYLRGKFPDFDAYAQAVPRLLPRLTPARTADGGGGGFSRDLYLKHHEYNAILGVAAVYGGLVFRMLFGGR